MDFDSVLEMLAGEASKYNYKLRYEDEREIEFVPTAHVDEMPVIFGHYVEEDDKFWYEPTMIFPAKLTDLEYTDSFEYFMGAWADVAKIATYLNENDWYLE